MTVYYSKGGSSGSPLAFETPANWNTATDGSGTDASSTSDLNGAHLVIQNGHYMNIGANVSCLSLTTEGGSHFEGNSSYAITVTGKGTASEPSGGGSENYSIQFDGVLDNDNQANFTVSTDSANNIDLLPQTTNYPRNLTINHASCVSTIQAQLVIKDKINIINGELNTEGHLVNSEGANLEVSTNASAKLTFGANNVLCGRLGESNGSVGRITQTQSAASAGIIKVRKQGNLRIIDLGTQAIFTGDVILEYQGNQSSGAASQDLRASSGTFDLIVNCTNTTDSMLCNASPNGLNDVTITKGIFDPNSSALTVAGKMTVGPNSGAADQAKFNGGSSDCNIGASKTDDYAIEVKRGGTFDGGSGDYTSGAVKVTTDSNADAKLDFTNGNHTITAEYTSQNRFFELTTGTVTHSDGTIILDSAVTSEIQWSATTGDNGPYNLTLNDSGMTVSARTALTVLNNFTILAGTYTTLSAGGGADMDLTVAGVVDNDGTLTFNGSTVNLGSTSSQAGDFQGGGTFNLDTSTINFHTAGAANFNPDTSANFDTNTSTLNLIGLDSSTRAHNFTFASGNLHNVTTSRGTGSGTHIDKLNGNCTITGNLTVGANSKFSSGTRVFTVNGDVSVTGELDCDDSDKPMTFGNLTIASTGTYNATSGTTTILGSSGGFALLDEGTFTHNGGTVKIDFETSNLNSSTRIHQNGAKKLNNVEIEMNRTTDEVTWSVASGTSQGIAGNLTLTKGESYLYSLAHDFDVDGDFLVDANGTWGSLGHSGTHEYGGLKLNSGSTFIATSGTTTITNRITGESHLWKNDGGTFTHNNGTVKFNDNDHSRVKENTFYNVEVASNLGDYAVSFEALGGGGNAFTILNNLTITRGDFELYYANDTCDIHGQTIINGSSNSGARFNNDKNQTATITHHGLVTIIQGTYHVEDGATVNMAGIRNVGGLVD